MKPKLSDLLARAPRPRGRDLRRGSPAKLTSEPFFHTTLFQNMESVRENGLVPRKGGGLFNHGGYDTHSQGKVFLAQGFDAALDWFGKVEDMAEYHASESPIDLGERVCVLLRVNLRGMTPEVDELGDRDVHGSWYVTRAIPPARIEWWHPKEGWVPISAFDTWLPADPEWGVERWEDLDEDEDEDEDGWDEERWDDGEPRRVPELFWVHGGGGFKPKTEAEANAPGRWRPPAPKARPQLARWQGPPPMTAEQSRDLDHDLFCPPGRCTCGKEKP